MSKRSKNKTLTFNLTVAEYARFWKAVSLLDESKKTPGFLKMLNKIIELYSP